MITARITYVIDKEGIIRRAFRHALNIGKHLKDTLSALEAVDSVSA